MSGKAAPQIWSEYGCNHGSVAAARFTSDAPVVALSWQDVGSGVGAFLFTAIALGVRDRDQPAGRVVGAAALAGAVATLFDIFVL